MPVSTVVDFIYPYGVSAGNHSHPARMWSAAQSPITKQIALLFYMHGDWEWMAYYSTSDKTLNKSKSWEYALGFFCCVLIANGDKKCAFLFHGNLQVCGFAAESEGHAKDHLRFKMLLGSPVRDRFPSIWVSVTIQSILIKYVSRPQALTEAKMETSNSSGSKTKSEENWSFLSFFFLFALQMENLIIEQRRVVKW